MEVLCRLSYSGGQGMIAMAPARPTWNHRATRPVLALLVVLASLVTACSGGGRPAAATTPADRVRIRTAGGTVTLRVEIADTPAERERGLMGRTSLPADQGMAFVWDQPVRARFWMKDTLIPLSIAFWDHDGRIVALREMVPCRREPCRTYDAGAPFVGAVEANRGFFAHHGVAVGDVVELGRSDA